MNLAINNQSNVNFKRIKIIKVGDKKMHYGPINYLGLDNYFKENLKPLNKIAKARKLDIKLGSNNKVNHYNPEFYNIDVYVGLDNKKIASVNIINGDIEHPSKEITKNKLDELFNEISSYINLN